jgi:chitinase
LTPEERAFAAATAVPLHPAAPAQRRLSPWRILALLAAIAVVGGSIVGFRSASGPAAPAVIQSAFLPYVDVTATPQYGFENARPSGVALGFVVGAKSDGCEPSWGGTYTLGRASTALDLDRRIARYRQRGGQAIVSFGGAANTELAASCTDINRLTSAYTAVIDRYSARVIDLDLEGSALSSAAVTRRAEALHAVQQQNRRAGHSMQIWLTLPVDPSGLTAAGSAALTAMLDARVELTGVNGLIMNYGSSSATGVARADTDQSALAGLAGDLERAYAHAGKKIDSAQAWQLVGATPMIGQNDTVAERFTVGDAKDLLAFATSKHLRRLSMWSLNRDQPCGPNYANVAIVSPNCSGVSERAGEFADIFAHFTNGKAKSGTRTPAPAPPTATSLVDDPATSPYPIWNPALPYPAGTKIVWHHTVYQAKWWTKGTAPDTPVTSSSQTPWTLIGPVLPGEHPAPTPTLPAGTYPEWSPDETYRAGARVLYHGSGYQAKWYTQGDTPGIVVSDPGQTPWELITSR